MGFHDPERIEPFNNPRRNLGKSVNKDMYDNPEAERQQTTLSEENIAVTLRSIKQSKGKKGPVEWIQDSRVSIKLPLALAAIAKAKKAIDTKTKCLIRK